MQAGVGLLVTDVMPIYMIIPRYSHNYSLFYQFLNIICSSTVILMLSWENPLVKPMAPGSALHHISFWSTILVYYLFCNLYFPIYTIKIPKIFILLSLSDLTFVWRDWQPLYRVGCKYLFVCVGTTIGDLWDPPTRLIPWFSKTEGNTYATLLHHPFLFKGKPTQVLKR